MDIALVFYALALTILQYIFEIIFLDFTSLCKGEKKEWLRKIEGDLLLLITALGPCMSAACTFFFLLSTSYQDAFQGWYRSSDRLKILT